MLPKEFSLQDYSLLVATPDLTTGEQIVIAEMLSNPVIKRYLQILIANQIRDFAEIPLTNLTEAKNIENIVIQAYLKGGLSILYTLYNFKKAEPTSVQANQGQRPQQP